MSFVLKYVLCFLLVSNVQTEFQDLEYFVSKLTFKELILYCFTYEDTFTFFFKQLSTSSHVKPISIKEILQGFTT